VQQLVGVHLAQPVQQRDEGSADEALGELGVVFLDVELQGASAHVGHHHVARLVRAEEILDPHHVRVLDHRERPALLEEALEAVPEHRLRRLVGDDDLGPLGPERQRRGQVLLDRELGARLVAREVDDAEPARGQRLLDPVTVQRVAGR
jgi:hypothetical protein